MYLLLSSVHRHNGAHSLTLLSSHIVLIVFFQILHAAIVVVFPRPIEIMYYIEGYIYIRY